MEIKNGDADVCIGTWAWGPGSNGSKMVFGKSYPVSQLEDTFEKAYKAGYMMWDTAEVYGMGTAEQILKDCIADKSIFLSTKHFPKKKYEQGEVEKSLDGSLKRLLVPHVNLYWLHTPTNIEENMSEMARCVKEGKIKYIGISNANIIQIKQAQEVLSRFGLKLYAVQNHYSLLAMERQAEVLAYCKSEKIRFWGYMVLEQGALSGHYDSKNHFPFFSMRGLMFGKGKFKKIKPLIEYEKELALKYKIESAQIPIIWAKSKGIVPIIGLTKESHVASLIQGKDITLCGDEIKRLELLAKASGVKCKGTWE